MSKYMLVHWTFVDQGHLKRAAEILDFPTPMAALVAIGNRFTVLGGFESTAWVSCLDQQTGVEQWRFEVL